MAKIPKINSQSDQPPFIWANQPCSECCRKIISISFANTPKYSI